MRREDAPGRPVGVRQGLARSYQITSIFRRFIVLDNVALSVQARSGSSLSFWRPLKSEHALFDAAAAILEQIGLQARGDSLAGNLAHGEQRQLEVGLALATNPKLAGVSRVPRESTLSPCAMSSPLTRTHCPRTGVD